MVSTNTVKIILVVKIQQVVATQELLAEHACIRLALFLQNYNQITVLTNAQSIAADTQATTHS